MTRLEQIHNDADQHSLHKCYYQQLVKDISVIFGHQYMHGLKQYMGINNNFNLTWTDPNVPDLPCYKINKAITIEEDDDDGMGGASESELTFHLLFSVQLIGGVISNTIYHKFRLALNPMHHFILAGSNSVHAFDWIRLDSHTHLCPNVELLEPAYEVVYHNIRRRLQLDGGW